MNDAIDILIVDDEPRNLDSLEAILEQPGYRLLRAESADQALKLLLEHDVAAIVLDIKMPGVSGFELAGIIKSTKRFRQVPILFLTAYMNDDQDVIAGYGAGAIEYLTKPINPQILRHKVEAFAELFRKTRALAELNQTLEQRVRERTAELETSEAALREADRQKDQFLATLAHELRNPLVPLRIGVDILLEHQVERVPIVDNALAAMDRQLDHMVRLIDDLMDLSRISRGVFELKKEQISLAEVVQRAVESTRPFLVRRQHAISVAIRRSATALVDPTRVAQILGNLLHNAAKFTPDGGRIAVELACEHRQATIRVVDSGQGIAADELDRVFEMFSQLDRSTSHGERGLGIGLALARRLAEMHGGSLTAASEGLGHGTVFTLRLPIVESTRPSIAPHAAESATSDALAGLRVVVIEDHDDIAEMLAAWLEAMGHIVWVARSGSTGIELVRDNEPDLVLCDIGLPELDGIEVCRRVRGLDISSQPVMVAITGWGREADRRRTTEAGFDHHLVKPVAADKLRTVLRSLSS
jgi:signal transduction histidine kinase